MISHATHDLTTRAQVIAFKIIDNWYFKSTN